MTACGACGSGRVRWDRFRRVWCNDCGAVSSEDDAAEAGARRRQTNPGEDEALIRPVMYHGLECYHGRRAPRRSLEDYEA